MGRLFWKFFFFVCLAQFTAIVGVAAVFWWERQQEQAHWQAAPPVAGEVEASPPRGPGFRPRLQRWHGDRPLPRLHGPRLPAVPLVSALLASLIFAALLARYFSKPIRHLRAAFEAAANGKLEARVGSAMAPRRDELADLGQDFDRMAARLQALMDGQRRLLHDVSHELRSPLARLQAAIDLARQRPDRLDNSLARIEKEGMRMDRLVEELLTLSRLEAGVRGPAEDIEAAELLAAIVDDAGFEAAAKGVTVALAGNCEALVHGNGELLHRALENVVRNAVKHTAPGSTVSVAAGIDAAGHGLRVAVRDAGPGVPESELDAIFEPFFRGTQPKDCHGHGLGLAITRRVIESLGGRIAAANRPEGGLSMEITLPVRTPAPAEAATDQTWRPGQRMAPGDISRR